MDIVLVVECLVQRVTGENLLWKQKQNSDLEVHFTDLAASTVKVGHRLVSPGWAHYLYTIHWRVTRVKGISWDELNLAQTRGSSRLRLVTGPGVPLRRAVA